MRIIFAGTPDFAAETLKALLTSEHEICAVYTQPDRPAGRGRKLTPSPVKQLALQHHIPVEQPLNTNKSIRLKIIVFIFIPLPFQVLLSSWYLPTLLYLQ